MRQMEKLPSPQVLVLLIIVNALVELSKNNRHIYSPYNASTGHHDQTIYYLCLSSEDVLYSVPGLLVIYLVPTFPFLFCVSFSLYHTARNYNNTCEL